MKALNNEQQKALEIIKDSKNQVVCTGKCYRPRNNNGSWMQESIRKPIVTQLRNLGYVTISNGVVSAVSNGVTILSVGEATKPALNPVIEAEMRELGLI